MGLEVSLELMPQLPQAASCFGLGMVSPQDSGVQRILRSPERHKEHLPYPSKAKQSKMEAVRYIVF